MKRVALLLFVLVSACRTVSTPMTPGGTSAAPMSATGDGTATPRGAVEAMLMAAAKGDLQAMSAVWGDEAGLNRNKWDRQQVESRTFIMQCVLKSDSQKYAEAVPAGNGRMRITVDLMQGKNAASTWLETARTSSGRWLVANMDLVALQNKGFCSQNKG